MPETDRERFEELVAEAVDALPAWILERLDNVEIIVEDDSPPGRPTLLGLYEGIPLNRRDGGYAGVLPDRITLFERPLLHQAGPGHDDARLRGVIAHTVAHEVAHHFGISDERLLEIDAY
jgi:predicted Zn-dependent protease with MMP-like domain